MKKNALQRVTAAVSAIVLLTVQVQAAVEAQFPASVLKQAEELKAIRAEVLSEYETYAHKKCTARNENPPQYKFLFIEARKVITKAGNEAYTSEADDKVFAATVEQFEQVVEYLANFNVDVVIDTMILNDPITVSGSSVQHGDVRDFILQNVPYGTYDTVITYGTDSEDFGNPYTSISSREPSTSYGYAWVPLSKFDKTRTEKEEHLYTVDLALHEWTHQLQAFRSIEDIWIPSADIAGKGKDTLYLDEKDNKYKNGVYEWENEWPKDTVYNKSEKFYKGYVEPDSVSYAHAYFTGALYDLERDRYVGMFPSFWKCYGGKCFFGEYYVSDPDGSYRAFPEADTRTWILEAHPTYQDDAYIWDLYYSLETDTINSMSKLHPNWRYPYANTELKNSTFTKVSFDKTNDYYMLNQATGKYLAYNADDRAFRFSDFKANDDTICWTITYLGQNFVCISPKTDPNRRFDVSNAWDVEDNPVIVYSKTGVDRAQEYQLRQNTDETYSIYPQLSYQRCVTNKNGSMVLATDTKAPGQKWLIEKANGSPIKYTPPVTTTAPVTTAAKVTSAKTTTTTTKAPVTTTKAPVTTTKAPVTTAKAPVTTTKAPVTTAKAPVTTTVPAKTSKKGDVNLDNSIDVADAVLTARIVAEDRTAIVKQEGVHNADVNNSGAADMGDITMILQYIARIISSFDE